MESSIELVVQGGAVGLAALAIWSLHYALRTLINHIPHIASDLRRVAETLDELVREVRERGH